MNQIEAQKACKKGKATLTTKKVTFVKGCT